MEMCNYITPEMWEEYAVSDKFRIELSSNGGCLARFIAEKCVNKVDPFLPSHYLLITTDFFDVYPSCSMRGRVSKYDEGYSESFFFDNACYTHDRRIRKMKTFVDATDQAQFSNGRYSIVDSTEKLQKFIGNSPTITAHNYSKDTSEVINTPVKLNELFGQYDHIELPKVVNNCKVCLKKYYYYTGKNIIGISLTKRPLEKFIQKHGNKFTNMLIIPIHTRFKARSIFPDTPNDEVDFWGNPILPYNEEVDLFNKKLLELELYNVQNNNAIFFESYTTKRIKQWKLKN